MNDILFSVVAPAYKDIYLKESIESVLNQTYKSFEMILVDDGSSDNTSLICESYASKDNRIRVFHRQNSGVLESRLFGISRAVGDWVVFIDDDDRMKPDLLQTLAGKIQEYSSVDCIVFGFEHLINNNGTWETISVADGCEIESFSADKSSICRTVFTDSTYINVWRKAVRRSCLGRDTVPKEFRDFKNFGDDTFQTVEILRHCSAFLLIPDILYEWRRHGSGLTGAVKFPLNRVRFFKEKYVVGFLKEENIFSSEDFNLYRSFLRQSLFVSLVEVATSAKPLKQKYEWYAQYRDSDGFYDSFLSSDNGTYRFYRYKVRALRLLEKRRYRSLFIYCLLCKVASVLSRKPLDIIS